MDAFDLLDVETDLAIPFCDIEVEQPIGIVERRSVRTVITWKARP